MSFIGDFVRCPEVRVFTGDNRLGAFIHGRLGAPWLQPRLRPIVVPRQPQSRLSAWWLLRHELTDESAAAIKAAHPRESLVHPVAVGVPPR